MPFILLHVNKIYLRSNPIQPIALLCHLYMIRGKEKIILSLDPQNLDRRPSDSRYITRISIAAPKFNSRCEKVLAFHKKILYIIYCCVAGQSCLMIQVMF